MFHQEKVDPSQVEEAKDEDTIAIGDFISYDKD